MESQGWKIAPDKVVLMYLRKSRSDDPNQTVAEVLEKHESSLQEYAERELGGKIPEENIYREVVSGESIDSRVEIKRLLARIEDPAVSGVLVIDPQRLSRGDLGDCDRLIKGFQLSKTQIITPMMVYNLEKKMERKFFQDELLRGRDYYEYVRDILFMGRIRAVKRGCYIGTHAPYGYRKVKIGRDHTLEIIEEEADIVRMMYDWYTEEGLTPFRIAQRLNQMGTPAPRGDKWVKDSVRVILANEHYIGHVVFNKIKRTQVLENGEVKSKRLTQPDEERTVAEGKHPAIIDREVWDKAQARIATNPKINTGKVLRNPLSGILTCGHCGKAMYIHPYKKARDRYECRTRPRCYKSVATDELQQAVLYALENAHLPELETRLKNDDGNARKIQQRLLEKLEKQMEEYRDQEETQFELLETKQYTQELFERRNAKLRAKMEECQEAIYRARAELPENVDFGERVVALRTAITAMKDGQLTPAEQNRILKAIVEKVVYKGDEPMDHDNRKGVKENGSRFTIEIFLRL